MSAEVTQTEADDEYTPEYGDQFLNRMNGDTLTVHDVRDGEVTFAEGGWDYVDDLRDAVEDIHWCYEPVAIGDGKFEGDGYGDY